LRELNERLSQEKDAYNKGIDRSGYIKAFGHAEGGYARDRISKQIRLFMNSCKAKDVLELGSQSWREWVDFDHSCPKRLCCINISEKELEKGILLYKELIYKPLEPQFLIRDAHRLDFPNESFDFVFGGGILHHLDFKRAVKEVHRILKKGGKILFSEPLGKNPVGKIVRGLTPNARTPDEKPLERKEIDVLKNYFYLENNYYQLFYVPAGVLSRFIFKSPYNPLTYIADRVDRFIECFFKKTSLVLYYRTVLIHGTRREL
jgi:SAM-dependent methyltransferase